MAKSIRSKVKKRFRTLKRQHFENTLGKERDNRIAERLHAAASGHPIKEFKPKNAFLYPDDPQAEFPQYKKQILVDFRSSAIEGAGSEYRGANRKKKSETTVLPAEESEEIEFEDHTDDTKIEDLSSNYPIELDDDDIMEFSKMGIASKSKKIKKREKKNQMDTEGNFVPFKPTKNKNKGGVKKSKKIMKF